MVTETIRYRYVHEDVSRHGQVRLYFRKPGGRKFRLPRPIGSPAFLAAYHALAAGETPPVATPSATAKPLPRTWRWLCAEYMASRAFAGLNPSTQAVRRRILCGTWDEPTERGGSVLFADVHLDHLTTPALTVLRDRKSLPEAANGRVKAIRAVYKWAHDAGLVATNPARDVARIRNRSSGFHSWTEAEIAQFEARWPVGSKPRLALDLFLSVGCRRGDVVAIGRQHRRGNILVFRPSKTGPTGPLVSIPILPPLARSLAAAPVGELAFLVTTHGKPFGAKGFGNWFKKQCRAAGLPHCAAHGLRKAAATRCAEAGATTHQLMAIFGWTSLAEAERYTRAAERIRLAASGAKLMMREG